MATKIQVRRDAAADWTSTNPTLAAGEIGFESDTNKFKIGDGTTAWTSLAYAPEGYITATSSDTLTNKTFDANGTGNSISNIETADIAAGTLVTAAEGIASNDNDTTIPTSAAVKAYADSVGGGGSATGLTFVGDDSTGTLISDGETVKIAGGTGITTAMSGDTMTITASGGANTGDITFTGSTIQSPSNADITLEPGGTGDVVMPAISFQDNLITTNRSNDDLLIGTNGTGRINISTDGSNFFSSNPLYETYFGSAIHTKTLGISNSDTVDANTASRNYTMSVAQNTTLSGSSASNSNFRLRTMTMTNSMDMAGYSFTQASDTRGQVAGAFVSNVVNSSATASTLNHVLGLQGVVAAYDESNYSEGDLTVTNAVANQGYIEVESAGSGSGSFTFTNAYNFRSKTILGSGDTITNHYGFYHQAPASGGTLTNQYAFYDASNSLSVFGDIQTQAVSITDNLITTNRSNDNLNIEANGTGQIQIRAAGGDFANYSTSSNYTNGNLMYYEDLSDTIGDGVRHFNNAMVQNIKLTTGQSSSNSNDRWRNQSVTKLDLNGSSSTATSSSYRSRGPMGLEAYPLIDNTSATASTLGNASGGNYGVAIYPTGTGNITITGTTGMGSFLDVDQSANIDITITDHVAYESIGLDHYGSGTGNFNITDYYHFRAGAHSDGATATLGLTNNYGFYFEADSTATNTYAFYDASNSLSVFGDIQTQAVSITDNVISTNRSNDDLIINSSGTGRITISTDGTRIEDSATYETYQGPPAYVKGVVLSHELTTNPDTLTGREYGHSIHMGNTLTASSSTNSNFRPRSCIFSSQTDMAGYDYTVAALSRGPVGLFAAGTVNNSSATTASTLATVKAAQIATGCADYGSPSQDLTINNAIAVQGNVEVDHNGAGDVTVTNGYNFYASHYEDAAGVGAATITNNYGFYYTGSDATNRYAFWDSANVLSRFGAVILANQASDPSTVADSAHIYAKDVSSSSEVFVRDEAGNVTQISPHNEAGEWQYWSENIKTGKKIRINMERMIRRLEEITGETFIENE